MSSEHGSPAAVRPRSRGETSLTLEAVESDFGWALGTVFRTYLAAASAALTDVPGGPRGHQVLSLAARACPRKQLSLAHHLGIDRTVMTYLLDDLENAGLIERRPDPADRRARQIVVTEAGQERLIELDRRLGYAEEQVLATLDADEQAQFRAMAKRLAAHAKASGGSTAEDACRAAEEVAATVDRSPFS